MNICRFTTLLSEIPITILYPARVTFCITSRVILVGSCLLSYSAICVCILCVYGNEEENGVIDNVEGVRVLY